MNKLKFLKKKLFSFLGNIKYKYFIDFKRKFKFKEDLIKIEKKIKNKENFAFLRFSDGELFILQNKKLVISNNFWILDNVKKRVKFSKNEKKSFIPEKHKFYRDKLIQSYKFNKKNYFKGISCSCCNGKNDVNYMKSLSSLNKNFTFSNLLQNGNYPRFVKTILKLLKKRNVILIANKTSSIEYLPFKIKKKFSVGENCFINDYSLIKKLKFYIKKFRIKNYIFLISASSLSNLIIYELFKENSNNTYIDIGSTLNYYLNKKKISNSRSYLEEFWGEKKDIEYLNRNCYW